MMSVDVSQRIAPPKRLDLGRIIDQINRRAIPELDLLNATRWRAIKLVCEVESEKIDRAALQELDTTRLKFFRQQWDKKILKGIVDQSIDDDFLRDPKCWKHICKVWGRHRNELPADAWKKLCRKRGYTHVPPGPYR